MPCTGKQQEHRATGNLQCAWDTHSPAASVVPLPLINWKLCLSEGLSLGPSASAVLKGMLPTSAERFLNFLSYFARQINLTRHLSNQLRCVIFILQAALPAGEKNRSDSPATVNQHNTTLPTTGAAAATRIYTIWRHGSLLPAAQCKHRDISNLPRREKAGKGNWMDILVKRQKKTKFFFSDFKQHSVH